jgi:hypothetical protein
MDPLTGTWNFSQTVPVINMDDEDVSPKIGNEMNMKLWEIKNLFLDRRYKKCTVQCEKLLCEIKETVGFDVRSTASIF